MNKKNTILLFLMSILLFSCSNSDSVFYGDEPSNPTTTNPPTPTIPTVISGCMDSNANNFNPIANDDNGSCSYNPITQNCSIANGTGTQTSNDGGNSWGTCSIVSCNEDYSNVGGNCQFSPASNLNKISGGANHSCGITSSGTAYCWGLNFSGQLGDNTNNSTSTPSPVYMGGVLSGKTIKSISTGDSFSCLLTNENLAYCFGYGLEGQMGNGSFSNSSRPVAVSMTGSLSGKTFQQLSVGYGHACAITNDNLVYCWGYNNEGQTGSLNLNDQNRPVLVNNGLLSGKKVLSVMAGYEHSCVLTDENKIYCWGRNNYGQLGNGNFLNSLTPVELDMSGVLSGKTIKQLSSYGSNSNCVLTTEGLVYCWGSNTDSQLGNGQYTNSAVPVAVNTSGVLSGKTITQISVGFRSACAKDSNDDLYCWGNNASGTLGVGNDNLQMFPVSVINNIPFGDFNVGKGHVCGISAGTTYCWGTNFYGELGDGTTTHSNQPVEILGGLSF